MSNETISNTQLMLQAELIVVGGYGVDAVYGVLQQVRDGAMAAQAAQVESLQITLNGVRGNEDALHSVLNKLDDMARENIARVVELEKSLGIADALYHGTVDSIAKLQADNRRLRAGSVLATPQRVDALEGLNVLLDELLMSDGVEAWMTTKRRRLIERNLAAVRAMLEDMKEATSAN